MAPQFDDFDDFCRVTRQVCAAADVEDYTHIWWDARIHPGLGTIEVRAPGRPVRPAPGWRAGRPCPLPGPGRGRARPEPDPGEGGAGGVSLPGDPARPRAQPCSTGARSRCLRQSSPGKPSRRPGRPSAELGCEQELAHVEDDARARVRRRPAARCLRRGRHGGDCSSWLCEQTADCDSRWRSALAGGAGAVNRFARKRSRRLLARSLLVVCLASSNRSGSVPPCVSSRGPSSPWSRAGRHNRFRRTPWRDGRSGRR